MTHAVTIHNGIGASKLAPRPDQSLPEYVYVVFWALLDPCELLEAIWHCQRLQSLWNCLGHNGVSIRGREVDTILRKGLI